MRWNDHRERDCSLKNQEEQKKELQSITKHFFSLDPFACPTTNCLDQAKRLKHTRRDANKNATTVCSISFDFIITVKKKLDEFDKTSLLRTNHPNSDQAAYSAC